MNIVKYSVGALTIIAVVLGMSLVSCSDKPTEPTVTKPSYKIAFLSSRDGAPGIFSMNNDGTDQKRLYSAGSSAQFLFLSWSPDGSRIAFNSMRGPHDNAYEIYVMRGDGSFPTRLTYSTHFMGELGVVPVWSPDNSKLAFRSWRDGNSDIHVMNADGSDRTNVTHDTNNNYDPVWRPDGMGVTFVSARDDAGSLLYHLYFANTDGTVREPVATPSYDSLSALYWFPVGSTIGYLNISQDSIVRSYVCTNTPGLTSCVGHSFGTSHTADHVTSPAWSPDGSKLAFVSNAEGRRNIYVMNTRDLVESPKKLTTSLTGEGAFTPAWSPDGAEIVFAADWTGNAEIYVINADGNNLRKLTTSSGSGGPTCAMSEY